VERSAFLSRLRTGTPHNAAHPLVHVDGVPPVRYGQDLDDPVTAFIRNAAMQGARVTQITDARAFVGDVIAELQATTVIASRDPEVRELGFDVFDAPRPDADLGVVCALFGIAATGTVVFHAGRAGGRSASLLPPAIVVLLREDAIVRDAGDIFRRMGDRLPDGLPSQLVLCTGPSKSGDIELELTTGVHGPGTVFVGILPPSA
jgi:L-lactate dehydrogenase complex protein LldG